MCDSEKFPRPSLKGFFLICVTYVFMSLCPGSDVYICVFICLCACPWTVKLVALVSDFIKTAEPLAWEQSRVRREHLHALLFRRVWVLVFMNEICWSCRWWLLLNVWFWECVFYLLLSVHVRARSKWVQTQKSPSPLLTKRSWQDFKKREIQQETQRESKDRELYCDASGRPVMTVWSVSGRYHLRGMDDPHSGTKEIRSGGGVTAGQEDLTDDGDIECVWQLI